LFARKTDNGHSTFWSLAMRLVLSVSRLSLAAALILQFAVVDARAQTIGDKGIERERLSAQRFDGGNKWAVLIGVNDYSDGRIPDLKYCVADAKRVSKTLTTQCGYPEDNVLVMTDDQEKAHLRPSRVSLLQQVAAWLKLAKEGDTILVFFSGHGFLDERGQGFLAAQNSELDSLGLTSLRTDELRDMLRQCKATQKLLVLDCCHAGGEKGLDGVGPSSDELGRSFKDAQGLITLASCGKDEKSREWEEKQQGLFTYYLVEGLRGQADRDDDGLVSSDELYVFTHESVSRSALRLFGAIQQPRRIIGEDVVGVFPLARVETSPKRTAGRKLALCIGVNKYLDPRAIDRNGNLEFADNDASELAKALRNAGFGDDDVVIMTTSEPEVRQPRASNIRKALKSMLDSLTESDSAVVSFAGYGMQFAGDDEYYLCPTDASKSDTESLVALSEVCDALGRSRAQSKTVIIDSCRYLEGRKEEGAKAPKAPPEGVAVLFSCSAGGTAFELADKRAGQFTYVLCEGLRGAADVDNSGTITSPELVAYVKGRLAVRAKEHPDQQQIPELFGVTNTLELSVKQQ
jgi:uncharacterized caspase-like protein